MNDICFYLIVPVYKAELYLRECIDSVLKQTYPNFRIVAVDDGSPDRCGEICEEYARQDSRITALHQKNQGQLAARQTAIRAALKTAKPTDFFLFLDSDDMLAPNALELARDTIAREGCDMVVWGFQSVTNGVVTYRSGDHQPAIGTVTDYAALLHHIFCDGYGSIWRKVTAARHFDDSFSQSLHHIRIGEDQLQFLPIYPKCKKVTFIQDMPYLYRCNPESITMNPTPQYYAAGSTFLSACQAFLEQENVWGPEDWAAYRAAQLEQVNTDLSAISRMDAPSTQRLDVLRNYLADPFFHTIIASAPAKPSFLLLAKWGLPRTMVLLGTLMRSLGKLKRKIL